MASAPRVYDFDLEDNDATALPSRRKASTDGRMTANHEQHSVEIGPFTKIPNKLFASGMARVLKPSATALYAALCENANRNGRGNTFKASDKALASETALSPRTICDARKKLIEKELIAVTREKGQSYFYTLTVQKLGWVPLAKRPRAKLRPRAYHGETATGPR